MSNEYNSKWYNERISICPECLCDEKIDKIVTNISKIIEEKMRIIEGRINELQTKIEELSELRMENKIREQNLLIRKHVPISFIPTHTTSFSEIRSNILRKKIDNAKELSI